jgi:hypothetical protein
VSHDRTGGTALWIFSGPGAIRTRDTRFRRAVLYPLSYEALRAEDTGRVAKIDGQALDGPSESLALDLVLP